MANHAKENQEKGKDLMTQDPEYRKKRPEIDERKGNEEKPEKGVNWKKEDEKQNKDRDVVNQNDDQTGNKGRINSAMTDLD
jgi:hypothetical protein